LVAILLLLTGACGAGSVGGGSVGPIHLGTATNGKQGKLQFQYVSSQCSVGCALDQPVLEGAMISIDAWGVDSKQSYTMTVDPSVQGDVTSATQCSASDSASCALKGNIETHGTGDVTVKVFDGSGFLVDSATFTIAPADRVEPSVEVNSVAATAGSDGAYAVHVGDKIAVHSTVYSGSKTMVFTKHGLEPGYSNAAVVASDPSFLMGATDTENAVAMGTGIASITMTAIGARATVTLDVAP
jgi:hypothetical protein